MRSYRNCISSAKRSSLEEIGLIDEDECAIDLWYRIRQTRKK